MVEEVNGVPCDKMFGAIARFREDGDLAAFRFSATNEWVEGTASESTIHEWYGIGADHEHVQEYRYRADHPTGILRLETDLSIIEVLARTGEADEALVEATDFLRRHPDTEAYSRATLAVRRRSGSREEEPRCRGLQPLQADHGRCGPRE